MIEPETKPELSIDDFQAINSKEDLLKALEAKEISISSVKKKITYEEELRNLQTELVNLQRWLAETGQRVAIIFEGRDAAGKGGTIRRFVEHLNPRSMRVVALSKPTEMERGQWYFRRYIKELPNPGEICFFDRSWYNRAVVEPVMGFCNTEQYEEFMVQVPEFEHMLYENGVKVIKFWFSISKDEQKKRFDARINNPLKRWKFSPVDQKGQELWDKYSFYKEQMFTKTHTSFCPWMIVKANSKETARLETIRHVLSQFDYNDKGMSGTRLLPDPNIIMRYFRLIRQLDN